MTHPFLFLIFFMFEFIFGKNTFYLGGYLIWICGNCVFLLFLWRERMGRGTSVTWDALIFKLSGPFMEICAAGEGLWLFLCVCARGPGFHFVLRVLACERVLEAEGSAGWLGPCTLSLGPGVPAPPLFCLLPPQGSPSALSLPTPALPLAVLRPFPGADLPDPPCVISFSRFLRVGLVYVRRH